METRQHASTSLPARKEGQLYESPPMEMAAGRPTLPSGDRERCLPRSRMTSRISATLRLAIFVMIRLPNRLLTPMPAVLVSTSVWASTGSAVTPCSSIRTRFEALIVVVGVKLSATPVGCRACRCGG